LYLAVDLQYGVYSLGIIGQSSVLKQYNKQTRRTEQNRKASVENVY